VIKAPATAAGRATAVTATAAHDHCAAAAVNVATGRADRIYSCRGKQR